jgi:hypothetical protein
VKRPSIFAFVLSAAALGACADSPVEPTSVRPAAAVAVSGNGICSIGYTLTDITAYTGKWADAYDRNKNGLLCTKRIQKGNLITTSYVDDQ